MNTIRDPLPSLEDDGLHTPDVGEWAEEKYRLVQQYAHVFTTSMRDRWETLVYVDLFAGPGRSQLRESGRIVPASPHLALDLEHPFSRYVFCDNDPRRLAALHERVARDFGGTDCRFVEGDVNARVQNIFAELPPIRPGQGSLGFCFADPYSLHNLRFHTIEALSRRYMDFLVLLPTGYDATRNEGIYLEPDNTTIDRFLGDRDWRSRWEEARAESQTFDRFMTDAFGASMKGLGYIYEGIDSTHLVRSTEKKLRLYRLAFFSRHELGAKLWRAVKKYTTPQRELPFS